MRGVVRQHIIIISRVNVIIFIRNYKWQLVLKLPSTGYTHTHSDVSMYEAGRKLPGLLTNVGGKDIENRAEIVERCRVIKKSLIDETLPKQYTQLLIKRTYIHMYIVHVVSKFQRIF